MGLKTSAERLVNLWTRLDALNLFDCYRNGVLPFACYLSLLAEGPAVRNNLPPFLSVASETIPIIATTIVNLALGFKIGEFTNTQLFGPDGGPVLTFFLMNTALPIQFLVRETARNVLPNRRKHTERVLATHRETELNSAVKKHAYDTQFRHRHQPSLPLQLLASFPIV